MVRETCSTCFIDQLMKAPRVSYYKTGWLRYKHFPSAIQLAPIDSEVILSRSRSRTVTDDLLNTKLLSPVSSTCSEPQLHAVWESGLASSRSLGRLHPHYNRDLLPGGPSLAPSGWHWAGPRLSGCRRIPEDPPCPWPCQIILVASSPHVVESGWIPDVAGHGHGHGFIRILELQKSPCKWKKGSDSIFSVCTTFDSIFSACTTFDSIFSVCTTTRSIAYQAGILAMDFFVAPIFLHFLGTLRFQRVTQCSSSPLAGRRSQVFAITLWLWVLS
jgi:hypothetical protein